jgi:hypothetical protein
MSGTSDNRRGFLGRLIGLAAGLVAAAWAVPLSLVGGPASREARPGPRTPRLRVRPLRREDLYRDHDLAG